jgi:hypothetical protein
VPALSALPVVGLRSSQPFILAQFPPVARRVLVLTRSIKRSMLSKKGFGRFADVFTTVKGEFRTVKHRRSKLSSEKRREKKRPVGVHIADREALAQRSYC